MSKKILELGHDFVIVSRFTPQYNQEKEVISTDDKGGLVKGRDIISEVFMELAQYDQNGNSTGCCQKIYLNPNDIIALANYIVENNAIETEGFPKEDLPF